MILRVPQRRALLFCAAVVLIARSAGAQEVLCDSGFQDCRTPLFQLIQNEHAGIDVAMLFMEDQELANAIIARFKAGVPVRALVEPRRASRCAIGPAGGCSTGSS
jgi:phosphatidylserine/phosphatidylglycerophosphate/cardiolipin synthase-like enzyme